MRRNLPIIFAILTLCLLILCSACVSQPQPPAIQTTPLPGGPVQVTVQGYSPYISFEEAKAKLTGYRFYELNEPGDAPAVYYLRARNVDKTGNATEWIFGVTLKNKGEYLVYDRTGWTTIANASLSSEEIVLDAVLSPKFLFDRNRELISGNQAPAIAERRDLELQQGIYKFTGQSGSTTRILTFNATTGALIP